MQEASSLSEKTRTSNHLILTVNLKSYSRSQLWGHVGPPPAQITEERSQLIFVDESRQKILLAFLEPETAGISFGRRVKVNQENRVANTDRQDSWKLVHLFFALEYFDDLQTVNLIRIDEK
ncbi:hypothetical protein ACROYT_G019604 [Oculina patagonica]